MARRILRRGSQPLPFQSLTRIVATAANPVVVRNTSTSLPVTKFPLWQQITQSSQPPLLRSNSRHMGKASAGFATAAALNPEDVLRFWFKDADLATNKFPMQFWFFGGEAADNEIKEKFGECLEGASRGEYDHWKSTPRGRVALVLVLDQFSRNCHRDSSRSFAHDEAALQITLDSIHQGIDQQLSNPLERYFLYMPLMHSESLQVHEEANRMFQKLVDDHKDVPELHEFFLGVLKFEKAHSAVLNKFGRYPSRNKALGRTSTPEEEAYLARGELWPMEE